MSALLDLPPVVKLAIAGIALMALACLVLGLATVGLIWFLRLVTTWIQGLVARAAQTRADAAGACYHEASGQHASGMNQDSIQAA
ncbi:hypothetical protein J7643_18070 [bacterium]|nr:hypothetical protein [bacterium]